jgi:hypothetical protein
MPYKEREISKMYYSMGEVSKLFDVNQSLFHARRRRKPEDYIKPDTR